MPGLQLYRDYCAQVSALVQSLAILITSPEKIPRSSTPSTITRIPALSSPLEPINLKYFKSSVTWLLEWNTFFNFADHVNEVAIPSTNKELPRGELK